MLKRICVFGASITWGANDFKKGGWVNRLKIYLESKYNYKYQIFNLGISGDCSKRILKRIKNEIIAREPEIIIFGFGNNDSRFNNMSDDSVETPIIQFQKNLLKIIKISKKFSKKIVFIGITPCNEDKTTPTIWSNTEYFTNKSIKKYNNIIKEICKKEKVLFLDQLDDWLKSDYKILLDSTDGLHPNAQGHEKTFQRVKDFLINNKII